MLREYKNCFKLFNTFSFVFELFELFELIFKVDSGTTQSCIILFLLRENLKHL